MKHITKTFTFLLVIAFLQTVETSAQRLYGAGIITGFVLDSTSGGPINYATLSLVDKESNKIVTGAISKENGQFTIDKIPNGNFNLKVSFIGFEQKLIPIEISSASKVVNLGEVAIKAVSVSSDEVEVVAQKDAVSYSIDKKVINASQVLSARGGTAVDVLKNVPSVNVDIDNNVTLRGSGNYQVLVDGKPSIFSGNDLLKQLPADMIENIEIITNPSAKYDPQGTVGIINIVMKKEKSMGYNGMISSSAGLRDKYDLNANMNFKGSTSNYSLSGSVVKKHMYPTSSFTRETYSGDSIFYVRDNLERRMFQDNYSGKIGAEYQLAELHSFSTSFDYFYYGFDRLFPTEYSTWLNDFQNMEYMKNTDDFQVQAHIINFSVNDNLKFAEKGNELNTSCIYAYFTGDNPQTMKYTVSDSSYSIISDILSWNRANTDQNRHFLRFTSDYSLDFESSKLEAGANFEYKFVDWIYLNEIHQTDDSWIKNTQLSNEGDYFHLTPAIYGTYSSSIWGLEYKLGLRFEYYERQVDQQTLNKVYDYSKFSFFPTVHISKKLSDNHQLQFSYSKRVQRPHNMQLNPYPDYVDQYYISVGNPDLKPEFLDSYEMNYIFSAERLMLSIESFYRYQVDGISQLLSLQDDGKILIMPANISENSSAGAELSCNYTAFTWLRLIASGSLYWNQISEYMNNNEKRSNTSYSANLIATILPAPTTTVQLIASFNGPEIFMNYGERDAFYNIDFALRQDLFDRKLSLVLRGHNLFGTAKFEFSNALSNYKSSGYMKPEPTAISLTLNYIINDYKPQPKKDAPVEVDMQGR